MKEKGKFHLEKKKSFGQSKENQPNKYPKKKGFQSDEKKGANASKDFNKNNFQKKKFGQGNQSQEKNFNKAETFSNNKPKSSKRRFNSHDNKDNDSLNLFGDGEMQIAHPPKRQRRFNQNKNNDFTFSEEKNQTNSFSQKPKNSSFQKSGNKFSDKSGNKFKGKSENNSYKSNNSYQKSTNNSSSKFKKNFKEKEFKTELQLEDFSYSDSDKPKFIPKNRMNSNSNTRSGFKKDRFSKSNSSSNFKKKSDVESSESNPNKKDFRNGNQNRFEKKENRFERKNNRKFDKKPDYKFDKNLPKKAQKQIEAESDLLRLNRFIAKAGVCSRREADELIANGKIMVNNVVITEMGYQVQPNDVVKYQGKILKQESFVYVLLNKPKDYITTTEDPEDRQTVMDLVKGACEERILPVGRLDRNTTGLLLLTNDGDLTQKLTHPSFEMQKVYQIELDKPITSEDFQKILDGVELEDGKAPIDDAVILNPEKTLIGLELHLGRNRIVRRIFEHLGYEVLKLDRTMYASLSKKGIERGQWRYLTPKEVIKLKYML